MRKTVLYIGMSNHIKEKSLAKHFLLHYLES